MPAQLIDGFDAPAPWSPRTPADLPSAEIALAAEAELPPGGSGAGSMRLDLSAAATGHFIRRTIAATDLSAFPDLLLWCRGALSATGAPDTPHRLRMELGSAALPVGGGGNDWHRYMHLPRPGQWTHQRLSLADLAPAVRNAVDTVVFRVADPGAGTQVWLQGLFASDPGIAADADAALLAALDGQLVLPGGPVPAAVAAPGFAAPAAPWIRLVQYDAAYGGGRGNAAQRQTDFTDTGHRLRPGAQPWDIFYRVDFVSADRAEQAAMVDFVIARLGFFSQIAAGGRVMRVHRIPNVMPDDALVDGPLLRLRVETWAESADSRPVAPVANVTLDLDQPGAA